MYFVKGELRKKTIFPNFGYLTPQPRRLKRKESLLQIFYDMQSILYHWIPPVPMFIADMAGECKW